jgi:predicted hotdog family 3-hydroxylacyl-ACP dehydratase
MCACGTRREFLFVNAGRDIRELVPHAGAMCLLERIVSADTDSVVCGTTTHRSAANPLRHDGRLAALHLAEYGAQAMAVHGGLKGDAARAGMLVAIRDLKLHVEWIDDIEGEIVIDAKRLLANSGGLVYSFVARAADRELATGRVSVMFSRES